MCPSPTDRLKLSLVVGLSIADGAAIAGSMTWWRQPFGIIDSPFSGAGFDVEALMPGVYVLFALALGAAAGAVTRRVLPAMILTITLSVALLAFTVYWVRWRIR